MSQQKPVVVVTRKLPDAIETRMMELFDVHLNLDDTPMDKADLIEAVKKADVLVPTVTDRIDAKILSHAGENLRLIANYGTDLLEQMSRSGETVTLHDNIDGKPMGKVNFVLRDSKNRIWITISTRAVNWMRSFTPDVDDGYVALVDQGTIRIVADGFTFTNEIRLDAKEEFLYVVETTGKRISRLRVQEDGELIGREVFGPSNLGKGFPDGITFDAYGNLWGTLIMSDQLFALTPEGECRILFEDGDDAATDALERAFLAREITPELMLAASGKVAPWMASVTFGGADLKTVYLGSLRGERIPYFRSPVAGLPMVHW